MMSTDMTTEKVLSNGPHIRSPLRRKSVVLAKGLQHIAEDNNGSQVAVADSMNNDEGQDETDIDHLNPTIKKFWQKQRSDARPLSPRSQRLSSVVPGPKKGASRVFAKLNQVQLQVSNTMDSIASVQKLSSQFVKKHFENIHPDKLSENIKSIFDIFDVNKDGRLQVRELRLGFASMGKTLGDEEVELFLKSYKNQDEFTLDEFEEMVRNLLNLPKPLPPPPPPEPEPEPEPEPAAIEPSASSGPGPPSPAPAPRWDYLRRSQPGTRGDASDSREGAAWGGGGEPDPESEPPERHPPPSRSLAPPSSLAQRAAQRRARASYEPSDPYIYGLGPGGPPISAHDMFRRSAAPFPAARRVPATASARPAPGAAAVAAAPPISHILPPIAPAPRVIRLGGGTAGGGGGIRPSPTPQRRTASSQSGTLG